MNLPMNAIVIPGAELKVGDYILHPTSGMLLVCEGGHDFDVGKCTLLAAQTRKYAKIEFGDFKEYMNLKNK